MVQDVPNQNFILTFYKPFLLFGVASLDLLPQMPIPAPAIQDTNYNLLLNLAIAFMEANRDGIDSTGTVTYAPLPGGADFSKYFENKLNTENKPEYYNSFLSMFNQIQQYWTDTDAVPAASFAQSMYEFAQLSFENTNRQLWLAPGVYTVPYSSSADPFKMVQSSNLTIGSFDGSPFTILQSELTPASPLPIPPQDYPQDDWFYVMVLAPYDSTGVPPLPALPELPGTPISNDPNVVTGFETTTGPRFSSFPGDPLGAIDAWLGGLDSTDIFIQLGVDPATLVVSSDYNPDPTPANGAIYGSALGTDGQAVAPGSSIFVRVGSGFDWSGLVGGISNWASIVSLSFYKANPWFQGFSTLYSTVTATPRALVIIEQQSIE